MKVIEHEIKRFGIGDTTPDPKFIPGVIVDLVPCENFLPCRRAYLHTSRNWEVCGGYRRSVKNEQGNVSPPLCLFGWWSLI